MQAVASLCLLTVVCSVLEFYKISLNIFVGLILMDCASFLKFLAQRSDFGCGVLVFGCFPQVFNLLVLFLVFCVGLKFLQFGFHGKCFFQILCGIRRKSSDIRNGLCSKIGLGEEFDAKIVSFKCGPSSFLENSKSIKDVSEIIDDVDDDDDEREESYYEEDQTFDVISLRKLVKLERQRANVACMELKKERMAAASAADEAMAMILRVQSERSAVEIEANQYRRMAEQKQEFDREVIQSLQWLVMRHEYERSLLEGKLKLCREKLKQYVKEGDDEMDQLEEEEEEEEEEENGFENDEMISSIDYLDSSEW